MNISLKFTITLAAMAIAALLPTVSAALKGTGPRVDDIDHHRALEKGMFGPPDGAPQKPEDAPGKQFIEETCAATFCDGTFTGPGEFFENQGRCLSLCKQCGIFFDGVGPNADEFPIKCFCFALTFGLDEYESVGECIQELRDP